MNPRLEVRLQHALAFVLACTLANLGGLFLLGSLVMGVVAWVTFENHYKLGRRDEYDEQLEFERIRREEADAFIRQTERQIDQWLRESVRQQAMLVRNDTKIRN